MAEKSLREKLLARVFPIGKCRECGSAFRQRTGFHLMCDTCAPMVRQAQGEVASETKLKKHRLLRNYWNTWWQKSKLLVIEKYGGKCACCGEKNPYFLTVDHINNDGAKHRREIGTSTALYRWLIRSAFPPEFRLLCWNCNSGRATNGNVCPHTGSEFSQIPVGLSRPESWVW